MEKCFKEQMAMSHALMDKEEDRNLRSISKNPEGPNTTIL